MSVRRCDDCALPLQWCKGHLPHTRGHVAADGFKPATDTQATPGRRCRSCEAVLDPGWAFCRRCGTFRPI